ADQHPPGEGAGQVVGVGRIGVAVYDAQAYLVLAQQLLDLLPAPASPCRVTQSQQPHYPGAPGLPLGVCPAYDERKDIALVYPHIVGAAVYLGSQSLRI